LGLRTTSNTYTLDSITSATPKLKRSWPGSSGHTQSSCLTRSAHCCEQAAREQHTRLCHHLDRQNKSLLGSCLSWWSGVCRATQAAAYSPAASRRQTPAHCPLAGRESQGGQCRVKIQLVCAKLQNTRPAEFAGVHQMGQEADIKDGQRSIVT
jgi:hypothetical protein